MSASPASPASLSPTALPPPPAPPILVVSPSTGRLLREVPDEGEAGVASAVASARAVAVSWAALSIRERAQALRRWRDAVLDEPLVLETLVAESGKPRQEAEGIELLYFCELIRFTLGAARRALKDESRSPFLFLTKTTRLVRKPWGVVAVITPVAVVIPMEVRFSVPLGAVQPLS